MPEPAASPSFNVQYGTTPQQRPSPLASQYDGDAWDPHEANRRQTMGRAFAPGNPAMQAPQPAQQPQAPPIRLGELPQESQGQQQPEPAMQPSDPMSPSHEEYLRLFASATINEKWHESNKQNTEYLLSMARISDQRFEERDSELHTMLTAMSGMMEHMQRGTESWSQSAQQTRERNSEVSQEVRRENEELRAQLFRAETDTQARQNQSRLGQQDRAAEFTRRQSVLRDSLDATWEDQAPTGAHGRNARVQAKSYTPSAKVSPPALVSSDEPAKAIAAFFDWKVNLREWFNITQESGIDAFDLAYTSATKAFFEWWHTEDVFMGRDALSLKSIDSMKYDRTIQDVLGRVWSNSYATLQSTLKGDHAAIVEGFKKHAMRTHHDPTPFQSLTGILLAAMKSHLPNSSQKLSEAVNAVSDIHAMCDGLNTHQLADKLATWRHQVEAMSSFFPNQFASLFSYERSRLLIEPMVHVYAESIMDHDHKEQFLTKCKTYHFKSTASGCHDNIMGLIGTFIMASEAMKNTSYVRARTFRSTRSEQTRPLGRSVSPATPRSPAPARRSSKPSPRLPRLELRTPASHSTAATAGTGKSRKGDGKGGERREGERRESPAVSNPLFLLKRCGYKNCGKPVGDHGDKRECRYCYTCFDLLDMHADGRPCQRIFTPRSDPNRSAKSPRDASRSPGRDPKLRSHALDADAESGDDAGIDHEDAHLNDEHHDCQVRTSAGGGAECGDADF